MVQWYVVRTKPHQELLAWVNLERQRYQCFCPQVKHWRIRYGKRQLCEAAFFPGYLFIRLDLASMNTAPIRSTRGVSGLVSFGSCIMPVPEDVINVIRMRISDDGFITGEQSDFICGQEVHVEDGPMTGIDAIFKAKKGEDRALLLLNILGGQREVEVPITTLQ